MIPIRKRDDTAESPDWIFLSEFFRGIGLGDRVRFAVFRSADDPSLHRLVSDEMTAAGPRLIAVITEPPTGRDEWHPAWESDELRESVEFEARDIARSS